MSSRAVPRMCDMIVPGHHRKTPGRCSDCVETHGWKVQVGRIKAVRLRKGLRRNDTLLSAPPG